MRYGQSKNESAELLRMALARMAAHPAASNPQTFAVWYEHLAGINANLSAALKALIASRQPLDDAAMHQLHRSHIADIDEIAALRISSDFGRVMQRLSDSAASTNQSAATYSERLDGLKGRLTDDAPVSSALVGDALAWTTHMQQAVDGLQHQVLASRKEVETLREDLHRTREESLRCPLTQVLNRKGFDQQLKRLVGAGRADGGDSFLVMLDIDHFKRVNDDHGHLVGDCVLEGIGALLRRIAEPDGAAAARYGGEEFALLITDSSLPRAVALAEAVRAAAKGMRIRQRRGERAIVSVTLSAGVAALRPGDDAATLVSRADDALFRSKATGRDRVSVADSPVRAG